MLLFESETGVARTGIVNAVMVRIAPGDADKIEIKLVQLKAGSSGLTADEIRRLKAAIETIVTEWVLAADD